MIFVSDKADKNLYLNFNCSGHRWGGHAPACHPDYPVSNPRSMHSTFTTLSGRCQSCSVRSKQYARDRSNRCETDTRKRPDNRRAGVLIWNGPEVQGRLAYQLHPLPASPRIIRLPDIRAVSDCLSVEPPQTLCPRLRPCHFAVRSYPPDAFCFIDGCSKHPSSAQCWHSYLTMLPSNHSTRHHSQSM